MDNPHFAMAGRWAMFMMVVAATSAQATTIFSDRTLFLEAVGQSFTDDYSGYPITPGTPAQLTNAQMSAVVGQTRYETISFSNLNLVGNVYTYGDGTDYCAGCNGNFRLYFDGTSLSSNGGVFGVGLDIALHTSRHSCIGCDVPGDTVLGGTVAIEFTDATFENVSIPADIGFFGPEVFFLGLTDSRGIKSLTIGVEPDAQRHFWVIDNLTIANSTPEPATLALLGLGLVGLGFSRLKQ